ncbi:DUF808 domain-containing protein [Neisseria leonii]|uniref:DUF808 domain-containing protein n=1 Tax=Neisseria leonii TaxID=2995413 RepID=A0A9X4E1X9_9NEIS|nr:DUF808 domain-containing protein [Neisseria sp. 51.81]MDD9327214.1 DUF808 domain-containing protein [Neisseria sp. 51.81]
MASASLLMLLDDITSMLDDVALMTKMAAKKTAGVVGDDLALNANQVTGVSAERELPVIWKVAKGSLVNKLILIPAALLISWLAPWLITPLLMAGGAFLCFEGVEKLLHKFFPSGQAQPDEAEPMDENAKIKGAVRTDFILSAEIIVIALGVAGAGTGLAERALMLSAVGLGMTVLVYGLVALIVKLDDFGLYLMNKGRTAEAAGRGIIAVMPWLMRGLSIAGTLAMFLVGGGIIVHGIPAVSVFLHQMHWDSGLTAQAANLIVGLITGALVCAVVLPLKKWSARQNTH